MGKGVAERGKGVGARRVGEGGWGDGGGEGGGERGWGEALIEVLNKTGIVTLSLVIVKHFTRRNRPKIAIFEGNPRFFGESPCNDITFSEIHHNLAQKVRKRDVREISPNYLCKKKQTSWKFQYEGSLRNFKCYL